ncbi:hypothetical protein DSUL_260024 [Desulfovibrionales bacterium]
MNKALRIIGWVRSPVISIAKAPKMEEEGGVVVRIDIAPELAAGLNNLVPGQKL